jgi:hypothetical protein
MINGRREDWIDAQQRARPLPITVTPAHNETLRSYLTGIASANHVTVDHLRRRLGSTRTSDPVPLPRLAILSGQPAGILAHAIHEITDGNRPPPGRPVTGRAGMRRGPCTSCAHARGHDRKIVCWSDHHTAVCLRHARWLGDGRGPKAEQISLRAHSPIVGANRLHRRIVRRVGRDQAADAYDLAAWIVYRWHDKGVHDDDFHGHMAGFHGPSWRVSSTDPTIAAATYPQTVALTRLLASQRWRARSTVRSEPTEFTAEVRRTVAAGYQWTLGGPYATYEPLVEALVGFDRMSQIPETEDRRQLSQESDPRASK